MHSTSRTRDEIVQALSLLFSIVCGKQLGEAWEQG